MIFCLLFNIRPSLAYKYGLEQQLLPLPRTVIIRKHSPVVKTDCGFDSQFFNSLKKRTSLKNEKQRHGVRLFDEIQLRMLIQGI